MRRFRSFCAAYLLLLLVPVIPTHANDGQVRGIGGRWQFVNGEHRSVRMVREKINLTVRPDTSAKVVADFWFYNGGPATTVTMGFPEESDGDISGAYFQRHSDFKEFRSLVDGRPIKVQRVMSQIRENGGKALWIKKVRFGKYQRRHIRVSYITDGSNDSNGYRGHSYAFTGGNWQGLVEESVLTVKFLPRGAWWVSGNGWKGNQLTFQRRNWQAQEDFGISFVSTLPSQDARAPEGTAGTWTLVQNSGFDLERGIMTAWAPPRVIQEGSNHWIAASPLGTRRILLGKNREWVSAPPALTTSWNKSQTQYRIEHGSRRFIVDHETALKNSAHSPHHPGVPFYVMRGGKPLLYLPQEELEHSLATRIGFDGNGATYLYAPQHISEPPAIATNETKITNPTSPQFATRIEVVAQVAPHPTVKATTNMKELAEKLMVFWRKGQFAECATAHYDEKVVSIEGSGDTAKGLTAVRDKSQWWQDNYAIHSVKVEGPFLGKNGFVVFLDIDMTPKDTGKRTRMREAATYVVENGKVVREEFFDLAE